MSTDANDDGDPMRLNAKVPERLLDGTAELAEELASTNRSEFVREVLRDTTEPIPAPGAQKGLSQGCADVTAGRTTSHEGMKKRFELGE